SCRFYVSSGLVSSTFVPLSSPTRFTFSGGQDPNDDGQAGLTLPFTFQYYDLPTTTITVSINGIIGVEDIPINASYTNNSIPTPTPPNGIIAVWWDDLYLDPGISGSLVGYSVTGTAPNRSV